MLNFRDVYPGKLIWNLTITPLKRKIIWTNLTFIFGLSWLVVHTPQKWLFFLPQERCLPSKSLHLWILLPSSSRGGTLECSKINPKKDLWSRSQIQRETLGNFGRVPRDIYQHIAKFPFETYYISIRFPPKTLPWSEKKITKNTSNWKVSEIPWFMIHFLVGPSLLSRWLHIWVVFSPRMRFSSWHNESLVVGIPEA